MATTSTVIADNGKAIETDRPPVMPTVPMVTAEEFDAILKALACREDGKLTLVVSERDIQSARHPPYSQEISTFLPTKDLDPDDPDPDWESQSHRLYPEGTRVRYLRIARTSAHEGDTERRLFAPNHGFNATYMLRPMKSFGIEGEW